jgi:hypothetical protein
VWAGENTEEPLKCQEVYKIFKFLVHTCMHIENCSFNINDDIYWIFL